MIESGNYTLFFGANQGTAVVNTTGYGLQGQPATEGATTFTLSYLHNSLGGIVLNIGADEVVRNGSPVLYGSPGGTDPTVFVAAPATEANSYYLYFGDGLGQVVANNDKVGLVGVPSGPGQGTAFTFRSTS